MKRVLLPPSVIGIIGGGQLGMMTIREAHRMGYRSVVWDPDPDCPASRLADETFTAPFSDLPSAKRFVDKVDVVTFEFEHIDVATVEWIEDRKPVLPGSKILKISQNRILEKKELSGKGFPIADFRVSKSDAEMVKGIEELGFPVVIKTATAGYDGKGQSVLADQNQVSAFLEIDHEDDREYVIEKFVDLQCELSVIVVRGEDGTIELFPLVENEHRENILYKSIIPARVSESAQKKAYELASEIVSAFDLVGVLCVEMFLTKDDEILVNELAPRPHNSGHFSLDACSISQFEALVRTVCNLPLSKPRLLSPCAMINLLGEDLKKINYEEIQRNPGVKTHLYGKKRIEPKRKMGHLTVLAEDLSKVEEKVLYIENLLGIKPRLSRGKVALV